MSAVPTAPGRGFSLGFLIAGVATMIALAMPAAAGAAPGMAFGIEQNGGMNTPAERADILDRMKSEGARMLRFVLRFDQVAGCDPRGRAVPANSPQNPCYDFTVPDGVVRDANARGIQVVLSVYGAPPWMFGRSFNYTGTTDAEFAAFWDVFAEFSQAAATRYDGAHGAPRVTHWTVWNEPNGSFFWEPRFVNGQAVGPVRYARMYDAVARRIKAVSAGFLVAAGPTAPMPPDMKPINFLRGALPEMQRLGSPVDAWAHNAYMGAHAPFRSFLKSPIVGLANIGDLTAELDRTALTRGKPIWITEFGYETPPALQASVSLAEQADWLVDATYLAWSNPRIRMFIWYALFDDRAPGQPLHGFQTGLFVRNGDCGQTWCAKPSAETFKRPLYLSTQDLVAGQPLTVWAQARVGGRSDLYMWDGRAWKLIPRIKRHADGSARATLSPLRTTWITTCDVACSPYQQVKVSGALKLRQALRKGLRHRTTCRRSCAVSARLTLGSRVVAAGSARRGSRGALAVRLAFSTSGRTRVGRMAQVQLRLRIAVREGRRTRRYSVPVALVR